MAFYAIRLDQMNTINTRGNIPDADIVTFTVMVNKVERGRGAGFFPDLADNSQTPAVAVPMTARRGSASNWIIGPFEIVDEDAVEIIYTVVNTSDGQISDQDAEQAELKILDVALTAVAGAVEGPFGTALGAVLGAIEDPIGRLIGCKRRGPCNGPILADTVAFSGAALGQLAFDKPTVQNSFNSLPDATEFSWTKAYTDEATHDTSICGQVARYEMTLSVLKVPPPLSVAYYKHRRELETGGPVMLRSEAGAVGVKSLLGILP